MAYEMSGLDAREAADTALASTADTALGGGRPESSGLTRLAVGVVIVVSLYVAREVLVPIALAVLLTFVLAPVVRLLRKTGLGKIPSVVLAVVMALAVILSLLGGIAGRFNSILPDLPRYASAIDEKLTHARGFLATELDAGFGGLRHRLEANGVQPASPAPAAHGASAATDTHPLEVVVRQPSPTPLDVAQRILAPVVSPLATTAIVLVLAIVFLLNQADLRDRFIRLLGMQDVHRTTLALDDAANRVSRYLLTQLALNATFGVVIGLGLLVIGVPNPLLCGMLAALCRFVPYIGTVGSAALPLVLAASAEPGWSLTIWAASLLLATELVTGQVVEPLAFGRSTGLSPVAVVLAAIFWAWMWGPIGLIVSTPLTVCLVVVGRHVRPLEFLDVLMGDRPALTPAEKFHQRILANDVDELEDQAEAILKQYTLAEYYDNVLLKGLQLVTIDAERGVVTDPQLGRIQKAMARLLDDVESHDDSASRKNEPAAEQDADAAADTPGLAQSEAAPPAMPPMTSTVLCLSGRGPLDDIVSQLLARRLQVSGASARVEPFEAASRQEIATLDVRFVSIVCICALQASDSPAHLRYLVRRLRRLMPNTPILLALLDSDGADPGERFRSAVSADQVVTSLQEAVRACLTAAAFPQQPPLIRQEERVIVPAA